MYIPFHESTEVKTDFFVRKGSISMFNKDGSDLNYLKMLEPMQTYQDTKYRSVSFYVRADSQHEYLSAIKQTASSILAEIGGIYTALYTSLAFICNYFTSKSYKYSLIKSLYSYEKRVDNKQEVEREQRESKKISQLIKDTRKIKEDDLLCLLKNVFLKRKIYVDSFRN
jgi:hypothetical protein